MTLQGDQLPSPTAGDQEIEQVLLGLADGSFVLSTPDGAVAECGIGVVGLLGAPADRLVGRPTSDVLVAGAEDAVKSAFDRLLLGDGADRSAPRSFRALTAGGSTRSLQFVVVAVPLALGWEFTSLLGELGSRDAGTWYPEALRMRHGRALEAIEGVVRSGRQPDPSARLAGILIVVRDVDAPVLTREDVARRMAGQRFAARTAAAEAARRADQAAGRLGPAPDGESIGQLPGLEDLVERAHVLRERLEEAEREAASAKIEREQALAKLAHAEAERDAASGGATSVQAAGDDRVTPLAGESDDSRTQRDDARGEVQSARAEAVAARAGAATAQAELATARTAAEAAQAEAGSARAELQAARAEAQAARAEAQSATAAPEAAEAEAQAARTDAQTAAAAADAAREEAASARADAERARAELHAIREAVRAERAAHDENDSAELVALRAETDAAQSDAGALRVELQAARAELQAARGESALARGEASAVRADLQRTRDALEGTRRELDVVRGELETKLVELADAHGQTERMGTELERRGAELQARGEELAGLRGELAGARAELDDTHAELEAVRAELERTTSELDATAAAADDIRAEREQAKIRAQQLLGEAERLRAAADAIRAEFAFDLPGAGGPLAGAERTPWSVPAVPAAMPAATREAAVALPDVEPGQAAALIALDGSFKRLDDAFCSLLGCREEDLRAARWPSIIDRDNVKAHQELARALTAGEIESAEVETIYMHAQGLLVPIAGTVSMHRAGPGGEPTHFLFRADVSRTAGVPGIM